MDPDEGPDPDFYLMQMRIQGTKMMQIQDPQHCGHSPGFLGTPQTPFQNLSTADETSTLQMALYRKFKTDILRNKTAQPRSQLQISNLIIYSDFTVYK